MANARTLEAGKAVIKLSLKDDTATGMANVIKRTDAIGKKMQSVGAKTAAAGGIIVGAFAAATKQFIDTGAALDDMAKRTGVGVESLSKLKYAAEQSGASLDDVGRAVDGMAKFMLNAERGSATAADTLGRLGVSLTDLQTMTPEAQFERLAAALAGIEDPTMRAAVASQVFGRAGKSLLPLFVEGPAGLRALGDEAERLGMVMDEKAVAAAAKLDDQLNTLKNQLTALAVAAGSAIAEPLSNFASLVSEVFGSITLWAGTNPGLIQGIAGIGATAVVAGTGIGAMGAALSVIAAHPVIAALSVIAAGVIHVANEFREAHDAVTVFDDALQKLQARRTFGDPNDVQAMITRFDQLAAKSKLTAAEHDEARKTMHALRMEFGKLAGYVDGDKIVNADKMRAQIQAARGGRSDGVQFHEIGQAEAALMTRQAEGADATEIQQRRDQIAKMKADRARTARIVADAAPMTAPNGPAMPVAPSGPPTQTHSGQAMVSGVSQAVRQGVEAAGRAPAQGGEGFDLGGLLDTAQEKLSGLLSWLRESGGGEEGGQSVMGGGDVGRSEAVLDARYAEQQFGGARDEVRLLTEISRNTKKAIENRGEAGGVLGN